MLLTPGEPIGSASSRITDVTGGTSSAVAECTWRNRRRGVAIGQPVIFHQARPKACTMPPSICPSTPRGLTARPISCTAEMPSTCILPLMASTSISATWQPKTPACQGALAAVDRIEARPVVSVSNEAAHLTSCSIEFRRRRSRTFCRWAQLARPVRPTRPKVRVRRRRPDRACAQYARRLPAWSGTKR
jgi:hypothetical protein